MKTVKTTDIIREVARLCGEANFDLGQDVEDALRRGAREEESPVGRDIFRQLLDNADLARRKKTAMCQDTGAAIIFVDLGQDVHVEGGSLSEAIHEGVRQGYREHYLRKSLVAHPLDRKNTGDNTPAMIYYDVVPGAQLKIMVVPKGGGSENMSGVAMLKPAQGKAGVVDFVVGAAKRAGANPCPPIIVGVGVGGTFERAALLAKKSLVRPLGQPAPHPVDRELEQELLRKINDLGIGPQGFGGRITALAVHVESSPCHIASLPVAVNIQCHAARHKEAIF